MPRLVPVFVATTSAAIIVAGYLWQQLHVERETSAGLRDRVAQLELSQGLATARAATTASAPAPIAARPSTPSGGQPNLPAASAATRPANTSATRNRNVVSINMRDMLKDPEFREAQRTQTRLQLPQNYPDVAKELGMTPAEADAFFDLLTKQRMDQMVNSVSSDDSEAVRQDAQRSAMELVQTQRSDVEALLGPTKYQQWQDYQQTLGARQQVSQLRTTLASAGQPLTEEQAKPLLTTMIAEQTRRADEARSRTYPADPGAQMDYQDQALKAQAASNARILDAVQSYLSADQLAALKSSMVSQLAMSRALEKTMRAQQKAAAESGDQPPRSGTVIFSTN